MNKEIISEKRLATKDMKDLCALAENLSELTCDLKERIMLSILIQETGKIARIKR